VALATLTEPGGGSVLFHCTAGKDRTGWLAAVTLLALGVDREVVYADYLLTNAAIAGSGRMLTTFREKGLVRDIGLFVPLIEARIEYLESALDEVERGYGDIDTFVSTGLGVDLQALRANLLT
ncbi:MAG: tyrosine-protein phosphatase, partial [Longispora sp.]|nr:tyrosine-protein phosphatase [Longispora sp. (in: high G+C Gram-positive bacteria)]